MRFLASTVLGSTLMLAGTPAAQQEGQKAQPQMIQNTVSAFSFREEMIGELSSGSELEALIGSEHQLAWVEKRSGKREVKLNGKQQGGLYEEVKYVDGSSDESHLAFFGKRNSKWVLVMDGQERPQQFTTISGLAFRPKENSLAYSACLGKKCQLIVDNNAIGADYEDISYPVFSNDGKRLAFLGKRNKRWIAVVDGKEVGPELDDAIDFGFDPSGNRFYVARFAKDLRLSYVLDGAAAGPEFEVLSPIAFSSEGKHYAYAGETTKIGFKKQTVLSTIISDGLATEKYEGKGFSRLTAGAFLSGGSKRSIGEGLRDFSVEFDGLSSPAFSAVGKLVYAVRRGEGDIAVLAGSDSGPGFDAILSPITFTGDSKHFAYIGTHGGTFVEVRDNLPTRTFSLSAANNGPAETEWLGLTEDAAHIAFLIAFGREPSKARRTLIVDGHESKTYDELAGMRFTEDGTALIFVARDGVRLLRVTYQLH